MIKTLVFNHPFAYELERLIRSYFPPVRFDLLNNVQADEIPADGYVLTELVEEGEGLTLRARISDGKTLEKSETISAACDPQERERALSVLTARLMTEFTGIVLDWGILTGIRPVKLIEKALSTRPDGEEYLRERLLISEKKLSLAKKIIAVQKKPLRTMPLNSFSLYVSIPFCPARCSYCSFVSHSVKTAAKLIPDYVRLLAEEMRRTAKIARDLGLTLDAVYFGGGTPTVLSADELRFLFNALGAFDMSAVREFTVEAGRPDTITREKLAAIKAAGADRISINPQTMNDSVLAAVGRNHTAEDIERCYELARSMGFDKINADLIAGLPTDTAEGFAESLERLLKLRPENVTVHNLSIKRSAALYWEEARYTPTRIGEMVSGAQERLISSGYEPYYLYRQKNSLENHENVGYALPGCESLYNIYIMEERQTILAAGCSGSTKLVKNGKITRICNFKYPYEYIGRFEECMEKKRAVYDFYIDNKNDK